MRGKVLKSLNSAAGLDVEILRKHLKGKLPAHMLPSVIVLLDKLPLTTNGKVNYQALPSPEERDVSRADLYAEPQNELEERIAVVWQKVLGLKRVSVYENFFELGGHSLLMVQLHRRVRESLNREIRLVEMFRFPTINSLAKYLKQGESASETGFEKINHRVSRREEALERRRKFNLERKQS